MGTMCSEGRLPKKIPWALPKGSTSRQMVGSSSPFSLPFTHLCAEEPRPGGDGWSVAIGATEAMRMGQKNHCIQVNARIR